MIALQGASYYRISPMASWPGVSVLWPGASIMGADDCQVTTVFTVQPSFHHWHSTNQASWSVTIVAEHAVTPHLAVRRWCSMVTFYDTWVVERWWWNDCWTVKTVVTWRSPASMIPAPGVKASLICSSYISIGVREFIQAYLSLRMWDTFCMLLAQSANKKQILSARRSSSHKWRSELKDTKWGCVCLY